jgi:hypothetical protein
VDTGDTECVHNPGRLAAMTEPHTTPRHIRIPDDLWEQCGDLATLQGKSRAAVINELLRWYVHDMGRPAMPQLMTPPRPE